MIDKAFHFLLMFRNVDSVSKRNFGSESICFAAGREMVFFDR